MRTVNIKKLPASEERMQGQLGISQEETGEGYGLAP